MTKYTVTYEVEVYAETPVEAFRSGTEKTIATAEAVRDAQMAEPLCAGGLPSLGMFGAPHTGGVLNGWLMRYSIRETES